MNEKDLLLIKTLFEEKNITHTAKRLFISQPAISDRLQRLESELNCALIVRQPVNDTLRMYKNDDIRMYNFNCITDTIVEVITTCNTYTLLTVHLL